MDSLLEFCESKSVGPEIKNDIECSTVVYIKKASTSTMNRNVELTQQFLRDNLLAVPMDKSNGFAIITKDSYDMKMLNILKGHKFETF